MISFEKINPIKILIEHHNTFYDASVKDKNNNSVIDCFEIIGYYFIAFILAVIIFFISNNGVVCSKSISMFMSSVLNIVAIFAPLLLSTLVLVFDIRVKLNNTCNNSSVETTNVNTKLKLATEMFANICYSELLCITIIVVILISLIMQSQFIINILFSLTVFLLSIFLFTLLMVLKRLFSLIQNS